MRKPYPAGRAAVLLGCVFGLAGARGSVAAAAAVEPKADEVFRRMSRFLSAAQQFSFEAHDMADELVESGQKIQFASMRRIAVRRPNKVAADVAGDLLDEQVCYDGKSLAILDRRENAYGAIEVPDNIDAMLDYTAQYFGVIMPLADLLLSDCHAAVIGDVRAGWYVGLHQVQGVKCHHLAFQHDDLDWQIWIEDGERPLPRKLVITYKAVPGQPQYIALLDGWDFSPSLADASFTLTPPPGAKPIELKPVAERPGTGRTPTEEVSPGDENAQPTDK